MSNLKKAGGSVDYDFHGPLWLRRLLGEGNPFKAPAVLTFGPGTTDRDLSGIGSFPEVRYL